LQKEIFVLNEELYELCNNPDSDFKYFFYDLWHSLFYLATHEKRIQEVWIGKSRIIYYPAGINFKFKTWHIFNKKD